MLNRPTPTPPRLRKLLRLPALVLFVTTANAAYPVTAVRQEFPDLDCVIEPSETVSISSPVEGVVEHLHVERNDSVRQGQVLAELEASVERASVALAKERAAVRAEISLNRVTLGFDERNQQRIDKLFDQSAVALRAKDEAETDVNRSKWLVAKAREDKRIAERELERARASLALKTIRSPITGVVVERNMSIGEFVDDQPMLRVAQLDPLRVDVIVPSTLFGRVHVGMRAKVVPQLGGTRKRIAKVSMVDRVIDPRSGTFDVRLELPNADGTLPSGAKCTVAFLTGDTPAPTARRPDAAQISQHKLNTDARLPSSDANTVVRRSHRFPRMPRLELQLSRILKSRALRTSGKNNASEKRVPSRHSSLCRDLGPFKSKRQLDMAKSELGNNPISVTTRDKYAQGVADNTQLILATPAPGQSAHTLAQRLRAAGVDDLHVFTHGPHVGHVSLGVYTHKQYAAKRVAEIRALDIASTVTARPRDNQAVWLQAEVAHSGLDANVFTNTLAHIAENMEVSITPCVVDAPDGIQLVYAPWQH